MWFYDLGGAPWPDVHALARALAQSGRESALVAFPKPACLCVGGEVDFDHLIDSEFCRTQHIPVLRQETRNRAMCFAQSQVELYVILKQGHRVLSQDGNSIFRTVLSPIFDVCQDLQLNPEYRPPNEILVRGRQIAAACVGEVNECIVAAASLVLKFDAESFARLLRTPDENVRARVFDLVGTRRTSLHRELGWLPPPHVLTRTLRNYLQHRVGGLRPGVIDPRLRAQMATAAAQFPAERARPAPTRDGWSLYIGAGAELRGSSHKAPGGFLRATCEWQDGRIVKALLGGSFFCYPPGALLRFEEALVGVSSDQVAAKVDDAYHQLGLVTPGVQPAHWVKALMPSHA